MENVELKNNYIAVPIIMGTVKLQVCAKVYIDNKLVDVHRTLNAFKIFKGVKEFFFGYFDEDREEPEDGKIEMIVEIPQNSVEITLKQTIITEEDTSEENDIHLDLQQIANLISQAETKYIPEDALFVLNPDYE